MNTTEAKVLLLERLAVWRALAYGDLVARVDKATCSDVVGPSGVQYQIEIEPVWDEKLGGNVRVLGSIDGGGISAIAPLSSDFIMAPDGSFVGE
jgi:hypothetical protein